MSEKTTKTKTSEASSNCKNDATKATKEEAKAAVKAKRYWNDAKASETVKGAFTEAEIAAVTRGLCDYAEAYQLDQAQLLKLITDPIAAKSGSVWPQIAEKVPHRSVQSVQNLCKRRFSPFNYRGRWSAEEEAALFKLYEQFGRRWTEIGRALNRTPTNVRDKWKQLGEEQNLERRRQRVWEFAEVIKMVRLIERTKNMRIFDTENDALLKTQFEDFCQKNLEGRKIRISGKFLNQAQKRVVCHHFCKEALDSLPALNVNWSRVARELKTKSKDDCRNKWFKQLMALPASAGKASKHNIETPACVNSHCFKLKDLKILLSRVKQQAAAAEEGVAWEKTGLPNAEAMWRFVKATVPQTQPLSSYLDFALAFFVEQIRAKKYTKDQNREEKNELLCCFKKIKQT